MSIARASELRPSASGVLRIWPRGWDIRKGNIGMVQAPSYDPDQDLHESGGDSERGSIRPACEVGSVVSVEGSWLYERYGNGVVTGSWGRTTEVTFKDEAGGEHIGHYTRLIPQPKQTNPHT